MARKQRKSPKRPNDPAKETAKKARRLERQAREAAERRQASRRRRTRQIVLVALGLGLGGLLVLAFLGAFTTELPGVQRPLNQGRGHVAAGQTVQYGTATPTSGRHATSSAQCGIFSQQVPAELAVHALEHGTVVVWYSEDNGAIAAGLREIVLKFDEHVILSPNSDLDRPVVVTAWNRLKSYDNADPEIEDFINTYRRRGPEQVPCRY